MANSANQRPLRVGAIFMRSGPIAELGADSFDGADVALRLMNDGGGINGRPLVWATADGHTPEEAARQAERMIKDEGIRILIGCYGSNHTIAVSKVCERHKAVLWVQTAWTATLFDHHPRYTFRSNTYAVPVEQAAVNFALDVALPRIGKPLKGVRVAVINEASAYGMSCAEETIKALRARYTEPALHYTYDSRYDGRSLNFANIVDRVREASPDVLFASSFIRDAVGILEGMRAAGYRPPIMMTSSAGFGLYTLSHAGRITQGILSANAPALVNKSALNAAGRALQNDYLYRLRGLTGRAPSGFNAMGFCAAYSLFNDVLRNVRAADDPEEIREVAIRLSIPLGSYPNGWGFRLDEQGQNTLCPPCIDQWQDGSLVTIWPDDIAMSSLRDIPLAQAL